MTTTKDRSSRVGALEVHPFAHPQGCCSYLVGDPESRQALAIDPHLDSVGELGATLQRLGWSLRYVVDTHTHADHPSGAAKLAGRFSATRVAHPAGDHQGVKRHPADGDVLHLGDQTITVYHAPGHTPDHLVLLTPDALFSGDTLLIGAVARTDFLGGDAGQLFDSIHRVIAGLRDEIVLYPGHDYQGRTSSTIGHEKATNPWLRIEDREEFHRALTANPPRRPANMDDLLRLNREGTDIATSISAAAAVDRVRQGGAVSVFDVRTAVEVAEEHIAGARHVPLEEIVARADEIRAIPAPRLILCRSGKRAEMARQKLESLGIAGLTVMEGGILGFAAAGGKTEKGKPQMSLERQVRIAAGGLVVVGAALGWLVHPVFFGLSAFVGAGLMFAGITDTCAMGLLIAKMPWNRRPAAAVAPAAGGCAATAPAGGCAATAPAGGCAATPPGA